MFIKPGVNRDVVGEARRRGDIERLEERRECAPVRLRPVRGGWCRSEVGSGQNDPNREVVRTSGGERNVPRGDKRGKWGVGKGQVEDRRACGQVEGEPGVDPRSIDKREAQIQGPVEVGGRKSKLVRGDVS